MYTEYREWPRSSPPIAFAIAIGVGVAIAWIANTSTPNETDIAFKKDQTVFLFGTFLAALLLLFFLFRIFLALYLIIQVKLNSNISFIVFLFAWQCVQNVGENRDNWKLFIVFHINAKTFWKLLLLSVHDFFLFFSFYFLRILMGFSPTLYKFLLLVLVVVHLLFHSYSFWNHFVRWLLVSNFNYTIHKFGFKYLAVQLIENSI